MGSPPRARLLTLHSRREGEQGNAFQNSAASLPCGYPSGGATGKGSPDCSRLRHIHSDGPGSDGEPCGARGSVEAV